MGFTTVWYRGAEFTANDTVIEVWLFEVCRQMDTDAETDPWLDELRGEWRLQATSGFGFGPTPALDKFLDTDDRRKRIADIFRKTLETLAHPHRFITPDELSQSGIGGKEVIYSKNLPTQMVIDVGKRFLALLD